MIESVEKDVNVAPQTISFVVTYLSDSVQCAFSNCDVFGRQVLW